MATEKKKNEKSMLEKAATFIVKQFGTGAATQGAARAIRSGPRKIDDAVNAATDSKRKQRTFK